MKRKQKPKPDDDEVPYAVWADAEARMKLLEAAHPTRVRIRRPTPLVPKSPIVAAKPGDMIELLGPDGRPL